MEEQKSFINDFEKWEPDARRRARPVLRERGGEIPPRHSPIRKQFSILPTLGMRVG